MRGENDIRGIGPYRKFVGQGFRSIGRDGEAYVILSCQPLGRSIETAVLVRGISVLILARPAA